MNVNARTIANVEVAGHDNKYHTHQMKLGEKPFFHPVSEISLTP
jgi:hypothetical protein